MQTSQRRWLSRSALCGACALACGGFEPDFGPQPGPSSSAGLAGWSYDAGVEPEAGRSGAAQSGSGGAVGPTPMQNKPNEAQGGEAGEREQGDAGEPAHRAGAGSVDAGGAGGAAGSGGNGGTATSGSGAGAQGGAAGALTVGGRAGEASGSSGATSSVAGAGSGSGGANGGASGSATASGSGGVGAGSGGEATAGGAGGTPPEYALIISEYVETSASFKAIELRALRTSTLDGCRIVTHFDTGTSRGTSLAGKLDEGDVYLLCTSALAEELGDACDQTASLPFNGDDAVVLECGGLPIDSLGQAGIDPGTAWESGDASTLDRTLRRRCSVTAGDTEPTDAFDPSVEWSSHPDNTFTGLGDPACD